MKGFKRDKFNLIGPVRSVECTFSVFEMLDGIPTETRTQPADYLLFDHEGRLLEEISSERELLYDVYKDVYKYDTDGYLIERDEYDRKGTFTGRTLFEIDAEGNLVESSYYVSVEGNLILGSKLFHGPGDVIREVYFDTDGRPVKPSRVFVPTQTTEMTRIQTDEGYMVDERRYNEKKELTRRIVTNYDQHGNELDYSTYEADGEMYIKQEYAYEFDSVGNWTTQTVSRWVIGWGDFRLVPYTVTRRKIEYF